MSRFGWRHSRSNRERESDRSSVSGLSRFDFDSSAQGGGAVDLDSQMREINRFYSERSHSSALAAVGLPTGEPSTAASALLSPRTSNDVFYSLRGAAAPEPPAEPASNPYASLLDASSRFSYSDSLWDSPRSLSVRSPAYDYSSLDSAHDAFSTLESSRSSVSPNAELSSRLVAASVAGAWTTEDTLSVVDEHSREQLETWTARDFSSRLRSWGSVRRRRAAANATDEADESRVGRQRVRSYEQDDVAWHYSLRAVTQVDIGEPPEPSSASDQSNQSETTHLIVNYQQPEPDADRMLQPTIVVSQVDIGQLEQSKYAPTSHGSNNSIEAEDNSESEENEENENAGEDSDFQEAPAPETEESRPAVSSRTRVASTEDDAHAEAAETTREDTQDASAKRGSAAFTRPLAVNVSDVRAERDDEERVAVAGEEVAAGAEEATSSSAHATRLLQPAVEALAKHEDEEDEQLAFETPPESPEPQLAEQNEEREPLVEEQLEEDGETEGREPERDSESAREAAAHGQLRVDASEQEEDDDDNDNHVEQNENSSSDDETGTEREKVQVVKRAQEKEVSEERVEAERPDAETEYLSRQEDEHQVEGYWNAEAADAAQSDADAVSEVEAEAEEATASSPPARLLERVEPTNAEEEEEEEETESAEEEEKLEQSLAASAHEGEHTSSASASSESGTDSDSEEAIESAGAGHTSHTPHEELVTKLPPPTSDDPAGHQHEHEHSPNEPASESSSVEEQSCTGGEQLEALEALEDADDETETDEEEKKDGEYEEEKEKLLEEVGSDKSDSDSEASDSEKSTAPQEFTDPSKFASEACAAVAVGAPPSGGEVPPPTPELLSTASSSTPPAPRGDLFFKWGQLLDCFEPSQSPLQPTVAPGASDEASSTDNSNSHPSAPEPGVNAQEVAIREPEVEAEEESRADGNELSTADSQAEPLLETAPADSVSVEREQLTPSTDEQTQLVNSQATEADHSRAEASELNELKPAAALMGESNAARLEAETAAAFLLGDLISTSTSSYSFATSEQLSPATTSLPALTPRAFTPELALDTTTSTCTSTFIDTVSTAQKAASGGAIGEDQMVSPRASTQSAPPRVGHKKHPEVCQRADSKAALHPPLEERSCESAETESELGYSALQYIEPLEPRRPKLLPLEESACLCSLVYTGASNPSALAELLRGGSGAWAWAAFAVSEHSASTSDCAHSSRTLSHAWPYAITSAGQQKMQGNQLVAGAAVHVVGLWHRQVQWSSVDEFSAPTAAELCTRLRPLCTAIEARRATESTVRVRLSLEPRFNLLRAFRVHSSASAPTAAELLASLRSCAPMSGSTTASGVPAAAARAMCVPATETAGPLHAPLVGHLCGARDGIGARIVDLRRVLEGDTADTRAAGLNRLCSQSPALPTPASPNILPRAAARRSRVAPANPSPLLLGDVRPVAQTGTASAPTPVPALFGVEGPGAQKKSVTSSSEQLQMLHAPPSPPSEKRILAPLRSAMEKKLSSTGTITNTIPAPLTASSKTTSADTEALISNSSHMSNGTATSNTVSRKMGSIEPPALPVSSPLYSASVVGSTGGTSEKPPQEPCSFNELLRDSPLSRGSSFSQRHAGTEDGGSDADRMRVRRPSTPRPLSLAHTLVAVEYESDTCTETNPSRTETARTGGGEVHQAEKQTTSEKSPADGQHYDTDELLTKTEQNMKLSEQSLTISEAASAPIDQSTSAPYNGTHCTSSLELKRALPDTPPETSLNHDLQSSTTPIAEPTALHPESLRIQELLASLEKTIQESELMRSRSTVPAADAGLFEQQPLSAKSGTLELLHAAESSKQSHLINGPSNMWSAAASNSPAAARPKSTPGSESATSPELLVPPPAANRLVEHLADEAHVLDILASWDQGNAGVVAGESAGEGEGERSGARDGSELDAWHSLGYVPFVETRRLRLTEHEEDWRSGLSARVCPTPNIRN